MLAGSAYDGYVERSPRARTPRRGPAVISEVTAIGVDEKRITSVTPGYRITFTIQTSFGREGGRRQEVVNDVLRTRRTTGSPAGSTETYLSRSPPLTIRRTSNRKYFGAASGMNRRRTIQADRSPRQNLAGAFAERKAGDRQATSQNAYHAIASCGNSPSHHRRFATSAACFNDSVAPPVSR